MKIVDLFEAMQGRVAHGATGQNKVVDFIKQQGFNIISAQIAPSHSKAADIILNIKDISEPIQIEVKVRDKPSRPIQTFETSVLNKNSNKTLDNLVELITNNKFSTFHDAIKFYRQKYIVYNKKNPSTPKTLPGYPYQPNTAPNGTIPAELSTTDPAVLKKFKTMYLDHLKNARNNYFALVTDDKIQIYFTGYGNNPFNAPNFPTPTSLKIDTFGGADKLKKGIKFRVGPKITLP